MKYLRNLIVILAVLLCAHTAYGAFGVNQSLDAKLRDGLIDLYSFDGPDMTNATATDRGSLALNGTLTGTFATSSRIAGARGQALQFTKGNANYVRVLGTSTLKTITTGNFSAFMWVRKDTNEANGQVLLTQQDGTGTGRAWLTLDTTSGSNCSGGANAKLASAIGFTGSFSVCGTSTLLTGIWYHVGITYSGTTLTLYVNGVSEGSFTKTANEGATGDFILSGNKTLTSTSFLNGSEDDVRIYNRALSATEVSRLYGEGNITPKTSHTKLTVNASENAKMRDGLLDLYSFDGQDMQYASATDKGPLALDAGFNGTWATSSRQAGRMGQGLFFSSSTVVATPVLYLRVLGTSTLKTVTSGNMSIFLWLKVGATTTAQALVSQQDGTGTGRGWIAYGNDGNCGGLIGRFSTNLKSAPNSAFCSNSVVPLNTWIHIGMTFDGTTQTLWLNGVSDRTRAISSLSESATGDIIIGASKTLINTGGKATVDDFRIYNRALTQTEITRLYQLGK